MAQRIKVLEFTELTITDFHGLAGCTDQARKSDGHLEELGWQAVIDTEGGNWFFEIHFDVQEDVEGEFISRISCESTVFPSFRSAQLAVSDIIEEGIRKTVDEAIETAKEFYDADLDIERF